MGEIRDGWGGRSRLAEKECGGRAGAEREDMLAICTAGSCVARPWKTIDRVSLTRRIKTSRAVVGASRLDENGFERGNKTSETEHRWHWPSNRIGASQSHLGANIDA